MQVKAGRQNVDNAGACRLLVATAVNEWSVHLLCEGLNSNDMARLCNHCCRGKTIKITYSECVFVPLGTQHAMHMRHIAICVLPTLQYFFTSHKRNDLKKKGVEHKKCVFLLSAKRLAETFFILKQTERDMITNVYRSECNVPFILVRL
jgi:tRNA G37 N-methylase Trm5